MAAMTYLFLTFALIYLPLSSAVLIRVFQFIYLTYSNFNFGFKYISYEHLSLGIRRLALKPALL